MRGQQQKSAEHILYGRTGLRPEQEYFTDFSVIYPGVEQCINSDTGCYKLVSSNSDTKIMVMDSGQAFLIYPGEDNNAAIERTLEQTIGNPNPRFFAREVKEAYFDAQGSLHRENKPALLEKDGSYCYYEHGQLHRTDGPASLSYDDETIEQLWYRNNQLHRDDGPAVIVSATESNQILSRHWWIDGERQSSSYHT